MCPAKKLILGGAQIGQQYGLVQGTSFSGGDGIQELLDNADLVGFSAIDTARTYGESEALIGESSWRGELHTKLNEYLEPVLSLANSLEALGRENVDLLYLCHDPSRVVDKSYKYWGPKLEQLAEGSRAFGVAIYSDQLDFPLLDYPGIETIQIPFNILSAGKTRAKVRELKISGKTVNARSVLAQGVLSGESNLAISPDFETSVNAFQEVSRILGLNPLELAFRWALSYPELDGIVLGVGRLRELDSIVRWAKAGPLARDEFTFVETFLHDFRCDIDLRKL